MPYIKQEDRPKLDPVLTLVTSCMPKTAGDLNYLITSICDKYINAKGKNYANLNEVIGVLECLKLEYYRRIVAPYEDTKIASNGDVYEGL